MKIPLQCFVLALAGLASIGNVGAQDRLEPVENQLELPPAATTTPADLASGELTFIGTATVLVRYGGITLLTDPNFLHKGEHVHLGYGIRSRRLTDPAISFEQLPPIDLVLLSHYHADHFDKLVERRLDRRIPIVTTREGARRLRSRGFEAVRGLDRWQTLIVTRGEAQLRITAMPGRHGPAAVALALPDVMGSLVEFGRVGLPAAYRMYVSGDTLVYDDLQEIPKRYPDIDLALLHLGGTRVLGILVTMDAAQGIDALRIVDPTAAIPIHYDDYDVFKSPLDDFRTAVREAGLEDKVRYLARGDTYLFQLPTAADRTAAPATSD